MPPLNNPVGWANNKYNRNAGHGHSGSRPITSLKMKKPASMSQQEYSGMTKSEKRKLPDPLGRDRSINVDGYPELNLRFNQVEFKTAFTLLYYKTREKFDMFIVDLEQIEKFEPSTRSYQFASVINSIYRQFEEVEDEYCTEQEVKDYVKEAYYRLILSQFLQLMSQVP